MRDFTSGFQQDANALSGVAPLYLLTIEHPQLLDPIRVVSADDSVVSRGKTYVAVPFEVIPPGDLESGPPNAQLRVSNTGRELMAWLELSAGGAGATVLFEVVRRVAPDEVEWSVLMSLLSVRADSDSVTADIGFEDLVNKPSCALRFDPHRSPGLY